MVAPSLAVRTPLNLGSGFGLTFDKETNQISICQHGRVIWDTMPGREFLSASAGDDEVIAANGNFEINEVDQEICSGQSITNVALRSSHGSANAHAAVLEGQLTGCGDASPDFSVAFWVPSQFPDHIAFNVNVKPGPSSNAVTKVFLTYRSSPNEDFYGFGAQGSLYHSRTGLSPSSPASRVSGVALNPPLALRVRIASSQVGTNSRPILLLLSISALAPGCFT